MTELPIVQDLADRAEETEASEDTRVMHKAGLVIEELYEALSKMLAWAEKQPTRYDDDLLQGIAQRALAKARGEQ